VYPVDGIGTLATPLPGLGPSPPSEEQEINPAVSIKMQKK
jgi:hypothetical protein